MRGKFWTAGALLTLLGGCAYDPKVRSGVVACEPTGLACPGKLRCLPATTGYACQSGTSVVPPPRDGAAVDLPVEAPAREDAAPPAPDAAAPDSAPPEDAATPDAAPPDGPDPGPPCPDTMRGPRMVRAGSYCVDATEVTNRQYLAFVTAKGADVSGQPMACAKNARYAPETNQPPWPPPPERGDFPVVNVDWCDAAAFCDWAGKRLCGKIGGGALARAAAVDPKVSQWAGACTRMGTLKFPYGTTFKQGACNVEMLTPPAGNPVAVGSSAGCQGGYDGLFDMVGNVEEWVDACGQGAGMADVCALAGGSFAPAADQPSCAASAEDRRLSVFSARGFRCCSKE